MRYSLPAVAALAALSSLHAQRPASLPDGGSDRWIVTFTSRPFDLTPLREALASPTTAHTAATVAADLEARAAEHHAPVTALVTNLGGRTLRHWWIVDACHVELDARAVDALKAHPLVARVFRDELRTPAGIELIKNATNAGNHTSDIANQIGVRGAGITIAIADSGCDVNMNGVGRPHRTFFVNGDINNQTGGGIGGSRLVVNVQMGQFPADDIIAHGTAVAACAAGQIWGTSNGDAGQAPDARIASYSMVDAADGSALLSTMVNTWQRIATDAGPLGIKVANLSYHGTPYPDWIEQVAMDAAAEVADIAIAVMAGNDARFAHAAVNVLAVGSVATNTRLLSSFSARGPLAGVPNRYYPDLVANGENLLLPLADDESQDRMGTGTSYASPQVAGAMALFRSVRQSATALEARAAVIASAEAIGDRNPDFSRHGRNAYGLGYLRTDYLVGLALDSGSMSLTRRMTQQQPTATVRYPVVQGNWYVAALAFNRQDPNRNQRAWSNVDLRVVQGTTTLGESTLPENAHERVVFKALATGLVDIETRVVSFEPGQNAIDVGLVVAPSLPAYHDGSIARFGSACGGVALDATLVPMIGRTHNAILSAPTSSTTAVMLYGASATAWGSVPLPLSLAAFGAPGCSLYVSPDVMVGVSMPSGAVQVSLTIPNDPVLVGAELLQQGVQIAPVNPLGAAFSNGLRGRIAGRLQ